MKQLTQDQAINVDAAANPNETTVTFSHGFKRGETFIKRVVVRKPKARALRGLSLVNLLQLDVNSIATVAPRVTTPSMTENDVFELDPADLTKLSTEIIGFFVEAEQENSLST